MGGNGSRVAAAALARLTIPMSVSCCAGRAVDLLTGRQTGQAPHRQYPTHIIKLNLMCRVVSSHCHEFDCPGSAGHHRCSDAISNSLRWVAQQRIALLRTTRCQAGHGANQTPEQLRCGCSAILELFVSNLSSSMHCRRHEQRHYVCGDQHL